MLYNYEKCKQNIFNNGWELQDNKIKICLWNTDTFYFNVIENKEQYEKGDIVFVTRNSTLAIIIDTDEYSFTSICLGSIYDDSLQCIRTCANMDRNYPVVTMEKQVLEDRMANILWTSEMIEFGGKLLEEKYQVKARTLICSDCGKVMSATDGVYLTADRKIICHDCRTNYVTCPRCQRLFKKKSNDKEKLCPKCAKREYVLPYHQYTPPLQFCGGEDDGNNLFLGLELEVDGGGESDNNVKEIMHQFNPKDKQFLYCMHDGSLRDGLEIITQPATLKYHTSFKGQYTKLFEFLLGKGYLAHDTDTCGIHIHFNRSYFKDNEELYISRLLYIVDKFWEEIVKFSRRNQRRIDRYTKKLDRPIKTYIDQSNKSGSHDYHYYAVNLANTNTIEFRMFKGSLNIDTLMATLQFVNNCVNCAKTKTAEEIQQMSFEELLSGKSCQKYWQSVKGFTNTER